MDEYTQTYNDVERWFTCRACGWTGTDPLCLASEDEPLCSECESNDLVWVDYT